MSDRDLTTKEKIIAAYLKFVRDNQTQDIAVGFNVNTGRVSEATQAILYAAENVNEIRDLIAAKKQGGKAP